MLGVQIPGWNTDPQLLKSVGELYEELNVLNQKFLNKFLFFISHNTQRNYIAVVILYCCANIA